MIDQFIDQLKAFFVLINEGNVSSYVGIQVDKSSLDRPEYHLHQLALIKQIIETAGLTESRKHNTLAIKVITKGGLS